VCTPWCVCGLQGYFEAVLKPLLQFLAEQTATVASDDADPMASPVEGAGDGVGSSAAHAALKRWESEVLVLDVSLPMLTAAAATAVRNACADTLAVLFLGQDFSSSAGPLSLSQTVLDVLEGVQRLRALVLDFVRHTTFSDARRRQVWAHFVHPWRGLLYSGNAAWGNRLGHRAPRWCRGLSVLALCVGRAGVVPVALLASGSPMLCLHARSLRLECGSNECPPPPPSPVCCVPRRS
jgi:hypothetical protein